MSTDRPSMKIDDHEDHNMPAPEHDGVQMADVTPMPGEKSMGSGQTSQAAGYAVGKLSDPKVKSIGMDTLKGWATRQQGK